MCVLEKRIKMNKEELRLDGGKSSNKKASTAVTGIRNARVETSAITFRNSLRIEEVAADWKPVICFSTLNSFLKII